MFRVNDYRLYDLGSKLHPYSFSVENRSYGDVFIGLWEARDAVSMLINDQKVPVPFCRPFAEKVIEAISSIVPMDVNEAIKVKSDTQIQFWQSQRLTTAIAEFETVLAAELQSSNTYFVSQKGAYSTPDLIDRAHLVVPDPIRLALAPEVKLDLDQAGRCLAFDLATAAGFHAIRATESVIRAYYYQVVGTLPKIKTRNWGAYIKILREKDANFKILKRLEDIKEDYRNPVLHPEERLTEAQALTLFGLCANAIMLMMEEVDRLKVEAKGPVLPFSLATIRGIVPSITTAGDVPEISVGGESAEAGLPEPNGKS